MHAPTKQSPVTKHPSKSAGHLRMAVGEATSILKCSYERMLSMQKFVCSFLIIHMEY
jgi:hypothetical protein